MKTTPCWRLWAADGNCCPLAVITADKWLFANMNNCAGGPFDYAGNSPIYCTTLIRHDSIVDLATPSNPN
jgi:hypothetical protein